MPDDPATVARREREQRTEAFAGLTSMTTDHAMLTLDAYWRDREDALLASLKALTAALPAALPGEPPGEGTEDPAETARRELLDERAHGCRLMAGDDEQACKRFWPGPSGDACAAWIAARGVSKGDTAACESVHALHRDFCLLRALGPAKACKDPNERTAVMCAFFDEARTRDWSHGCRGIGPTDCLAMLAALSSAEGEAACDRVPEVDAAADEAAGSTDPTRAHCLAVIRGEPAGCPTPLFPVDHLAQVHARPQWEPLVVGGVMGGRSGPRLAIAGSSRSPALCRVVSVVHDPDDASAVDAVETAMIGLDRAPRLRTVTPMRSDIDPFRVRVDLQTLCVPVAPWTVPTAR
ncbi:MAG: hypothetical protein H6746_12960 [Deltaproteobacteria bacterium]|nr:hypothetical protein [Deltaproteobacteria bacterium]